MIRIRTLPFRPIWPLIAAALATGACSGNRPFEHENTGAQAKLSVPGSITPQISVREIDGAPDGWKLAERVAEALRSRDIPAISATRSRSSFTLRGAMRPGVERNGRSRVEVIWSLYDGSGRKVGEVTQMAAVPGAAFKTPNEGVVEAMADAAAESIAPLVPSSSVHLADATETGERRPAADAEESLSAGPEPASETKRSAPARPRADVPPAPRSPQRAEADIAKPDVAPPLERREYAENPDRTVRTTQPRTGRYWLQLGAHRDEAITRAEWQKIQAAGANVLGNVGNRIQRADLGTRGIYYRIQVGPFASTAEAGQLCAQLKARSIDCFLAMPEPAARTRPPGDTARTPPAAKPAETRTRPATVQPKPPAEKPKDAATAPPKAPDTAPENPAAKPEIKPPPNASAEKPDVPISTAPGLPGVLD